MKFDKQQKADIGRILNLISEGFASLSAMIQEEVQRLPINEKPRTTKPKAPSVSAGVWEAYSKAFKARYSMEPTRNAQVNRMLVHLVQTAGVETATALAAFYVRSNDSFYVRQRHPVSLLLKDWHKLTVDMDRGRGVSRKEAESVETASSNVDLVGEFLQEKSSKDWEIPF